MPPFLFYGLSIAAQRFCISFGDTVCEIIHLYPSGSAIAADRRHRVGSRQAAPVLRPLQRPDGAFTDAVVEQAVQGLKKRR